MAGTATVRAGEVTGVSGQKLSMTMTVIPAQRRPLGGLAGRRPGEACAAPRHEAGAPPRSRVVRPRGSRVRVPRAAAHAVRPRVRATVLVVGLAASGVLAFGGTALALVPR